MGFDDSFVQSVRDAIDIVDLVSDHTRLEKRGQRLLGLCPFHKEKTPSFSVDATQGLFYCFGCGAGGDAFKFHMQVTGDDFPAATEALARRFGVLLPQRSSRDRAAEQTASVLEDAERFFRDRLARSSFARRYLEQRRIAPELIEAYGLGYAPDEWRALLDALSPRHPVSSLEAAGLLSRSERAPDRPYDRFRNRLMFPIRSPSGRLLAFGGRTLGDDRAKYVNTRETEAFQKGHVLYGLDRARASIREASRALLVEGYFDALAAVAAGIPWTVASMGTALTAQQARLLGRYADEVVIGYDGDRAGEEASSKALPTLLEQGLVVRRARFPAGQDPDSLRLEEGPDAVREIVEGAPDFVDLELDRLPAGIADQPRRLAEAVERVRPLLEAVRIESVRLAYQRRAAERLGVQVGVLGGGAVELFRRRGALAERASSSTSPGRGLEEQFLLLLLAGVEPSPPPSPEAVWDDDARTLYQAWLEARASGPVDGDALARGLPPGNAASTLLARLRVDLPESPTGLELELEECVRELERRLKSTEKKRLAHRIREAERAGDRQLIAELIETQMREHERRRREETRETTGRDR
ncbi:MAG TPA: DNA primase [Thermoanaerobaculia bacterium]|nr:DNA primase [Thermoanaerobaculia bacterium]